MFIRDGKHQAAVQEAAVTQDQRNDDDTGFQIGDDEGERNKSQEDQGAQPPLQARAGRLAEELP